MKFTSGIIGASLAVALLSCASLHAQLPADNPADVKLGYAWIDGGTGLVFANQQRDVTANAPTGQWYPQLKTWNNRNTTAGNRIWNTDSTNVTFPFKDKGGNNVTADASDAYWDKFYMIQGMGTTPKGTYQRVATSSFTQNCYGFATGKGYNIFFAGFAQIVQDEYTLYNQAFCSYPSIKGQPPCILHLPLIDHCVALTSCCPNGCPITKKTTIRVTTEVNTSSGTYQGTWDCAEGGLIVVNSIIYCPKGL
jgi:hypothetical protein